MEQVPQNSPDEEPLGPEGERLWPGEIDLTGVVRQDEALTDVIGDAIAEARLGAVRSPSGAPARWRGRWPTSVRTL